MTIQARTIQWREHRSTSSHIYCGPSFNGGCIDVNGPDCYYGRKGHLYVFMTFNVNWLDGCTIKILIQRPYQQNGAAVLELVDGDYYRGSMVDFPDQLPRISKGNGSINQVWPAMDTPPTWYQYTFSKASASLPYVTYFVDAMYLTGGCVYPLPPLPRIIWWDIYKGGNLLWNIYSNNPLHPLQSEWVTDLDGTENDYGHIGNLWHEEIKIVRELSVGKKLVTPTDEGGHWILGFWVPHVRNRLTKIRASDHNTPRTILQRARDVAKAQIGEA